MAYKDFDGLQADSGAGTDSNIIQAGDSAITLPDNSYIRDANIVRDGMDLTLDGPQGTITIEGYFAQKTAPDLVAPDGQTLTPELVESFAASPSVYASNTSMSDASPVGAVSEVTGDATVTRLDGSVEPISQGTHIFQGDVVETGADGAVNIVFTDETSFAVSEDARLAIDEYVFDPSTNEGSQDFSVLKGVFVFTSGLIGREDPDDVNIDTPSGSIGIRGTIIAGDVNSGEITVVEGAIVVRDFAGNEMTLANQFETAKFIAGGGVENMGQLAANDVAGKFAGVAPVAPTLFSSINDAEAEGPAPDAPANEPPVEGDNAGEQPSGENFDADGTVDGNADGGVDGTVDNTAEGAEAPPPVDGDLTLDTDGQPTTTTTAPAPPPPSATMDASMGMMGNDMGLSGDPMMGGEPAPAMGTLADGGMETVSADGTTTAPKPTAGAKPPPPPNEPPPGDAAGNTNNTDTLQDPSTLQPPVTNVDDLPDLGVLHLGTAVFDGLVPAWAPNIAPDNFFVAGEGQYWDYHFDLEFADTSNGADNLNFQLDAATVTALNGLSSSGYISNSAGTGIDGSIYLSQGWSFDTTNGHLELFLNGTFTIAADTAFTIGIRAYDTATGEINFSYDDPQGFVHYTFDLIDTGTTAGTNEIIDTNGTMIVGTDAHATIYDIAIANNVSNADIIAGNQNDTFNLGDGTEVVTFSTINTGAGDNMVTINLGSVDNEIIGGFGQDTFSISDVQNDMYGMDGSDKFILDLANNALDAQLDGTTAFLIDGGHSSFRHGFVVDGSAVPGGEDGRGDTLYIQGAGKTLDFTLIDDTYIRGIERIDLTSVDNTNVILNYNDVINMTDHKNMLIFRGTSGDSIDFQGGEFTNFTKTQEDLVINDGYEGGATENVTFDVYSDGNVTLLVEDNGAAVTGLT